MGRKCKLAADYAQDSHLVIKENENKQYMGKHQGTDYF